MRLKHWFYTAPLRLRSILRRRQVERELDEELRYHIDRQIEENIAAGMTPEEARYAALRAMGGIDRRKEECRDMRRVNVIENFLQDLRYGVSALRKNPGFAAVAILTLALGVGANTAIFSVTNATLLQPYPYIDTDRWVYISEKNAARGLQDVAASIPNFRDWRTQSQSFSEMVLWNQLNLNLSGAGAPERARVTVITQNLFSALNLVPAAGRFSIPDDNNRPPRIAIISYGLWERRFGGDPNLLGREITLRSRRPG